MMKNMKMSVILGIMFAGYLVNCNEDCYAASLTCEEEVLNELCMKAPTPNAERPDIDPRSTCFEEGKKICKEKYFSGFPECFEGDGTNGYAVLSVEDRLTTYRQTSGPFRCDQTAAKYTSPDWKGSNKWYRFGESGTGKLASKGYFPTRAVCGTNIGVYSLSLLPTACETRAITVCIDNRAQCDYKEPAKVTNCGSFFVYNLPDVPLCSVKYCSEL